MEAALKKCDKDMGNNLVEQDVCKGFIQDSTTDMQLKQSFIEDKRQLKENYEELQVKRAALHEQLVSTTLITKGMFLG